MHELSEKHRMESELASDGFKRLHLEQNLRHQKDMLQAAVG